MRFFNLYIFILSFWTTSCELVWPGSYTLNTEGATQTKVGKITSQLEFEGNAAGSLALVNNIKNEYFRVFLDLEVIEKHLLYVKYHEGAGSTCRWCLPLNQEMTVSFQSLQTGETVLTQTVKVTEPDWVVSIVLMKLDNGEYAIGQSANPKPELGPAVYRCVFVYGEDHRMRYITGNAQRQGLEFECLLEHTHDSAFPVAKLVQFESVMWCATVTPEADFCFGESFLEPQTTTQPFRLDAEIQTISPQNGKLQPTEAISFTGWFDPNQEYSLHFLARDRAYEPTWEIDVNTPWRRPGGSEPDSKYVVVIDQLPGFDKSWKVLIFREMNSRDGRVKNTAPRPNMWDLSGFLSTTEDSSSPPARSEKPDKSSSGSSVGAIVGVVAAVALVMGSVALYCWCKRPENRGYATSLMTTEYDYPAQQGLFGTGGDYRPPDQFP